VLVELAGQHGAGRLAVHPLGGRAEEGVVDVVRARHEGARFDSDVFLIEEGVRFNVR